MSDEEEYEVETVLHRMEFDALLQNALKSEAVFNPNSVKDGMTKHSKYAYLVHWKNFPFEQRTWEPEENLRTDDSVPEALAKFYKSNNYPNTYEEIDKDYGANMWDDLMVAWRKVADYEYLYSPDEKREKKEAEERKKREEQKKLEVRKKKIAARAESEAPQKKEKRRVIIESDPDEQNETSRKKSEKSNKRAASLAGSTESAKKQRSESVPPAVPLNKPRRIAPSQPKVAEFKKPYDKHPVVQKKKDPGQFAKDIQEIKEEMKKLQLELKEFPVKVEGVRPTRPFTAALWNLKFRRCRSAESLNNFFFKGAEIEIETQVIAVPEEDVQEYKQLVEENQKKMELISHPFKKQLEPLLPELVKSYSKDDTDRFKTIFTENIPNDPKYDPHRYALIVFIISYFDHREWNADPNGMSIVEAKESVSWLKIRKQNPLCCKNHRKCAWMKLFMELVPSRLRFIETSKKRYSGREGDDGPFRYDVYFHCMKYGAECQKRLFFIFGKPVNRRQKLTAKFNVDGMHLLAVQYGNIQRIAQYMSMGGADINAMATFLPTKQVFRLEEYLKYWIEKNAKQGNVHPIHADYYQDLLLMIRRTSGSLSLFVKSRVEEIIANRLNMGWKIHMDLTYPHILRCCPQSNISNGGDDCHQVLSCLFAPLGMALCDGIPDKGNVYGVNMHKVNKLRDDLSEFRHIVGKKEGRLVVALYRIEVDYKANVTDQYAIPTFKHIQNNEGYIIEGLNLIRQQEDPEKEDISLINFLPLTTPGSLYFCIENESVEKTLVAPGNVFIELVGKFEQPATFVAQVFFISKNID
ncbi:Protein CBG10226 [Caenorhabditis briggsae]|uniref:Protein CBG10226 n=1 Tax=Caenorhabditis briggsae TaxID=6238 RepID=A8XAT4_CAEBR|nr:Protein CBG10226 [Caenorhabditis briggsae]CAP29749.1 Protein CBG10226 [Caenorhabditis briggsae]